MVQLLFDMGYIITIEGGEFVGKTSVAMPSITYFFKERGFDTLVCREPGGTPKGEQLRKEIFSKLEKGVSPLQLARLFNKGRKINIDEVIKPHIGQFKEKNAVVILDRYLDSTRVYQGLEAGVPMETIHKLEQSFVGTFFPDFTLLLYIPETVFEETLKKRMAHDQGSRDNTKWDNGSIQHHLERQRFYLSLPELSHKRGENRTFALIDASGTQKQVEQNCVKAASQFLNTRFDN